MLRAPLSTTLGASRPGQSIATAFSLDPAHSLTPPPPPPSRHVPPLLFSSAHAQCDRPSSPQSPAGMHILVDAGNGAGGFFTSKVLEPLGADTTGSQFLDPDGNFPNHVPNPEDPAAMESTSAAVLEHGAEDPL